MNKLKVILNVSVCIYNLNCNVIVRLRHGSNGRGPEMTLLHIVGAVNLGVSGDLSEYRVSGIAFLEIFPKIIIFMHYLTEL